jgi:undecaprenyl diphosphate synthase
MPAKNETALTLPKGTKIPNHIAIIPDGNRRWARAKGLYTLEGHKRGFERATELARAARSWGVHTVTVWGFSTENWDRTPKEINYLMKLYSRLVDEYMKDAMKEGVKLVHLGRKDRLPSFLVKKITNAEEKTKNNKNYIGNIAIDYGGHDDIIRAMKAMLADGVAQDEVNKHLFEKYLDTKNQPYPYVDLLIRTSGEQRTSGLLLWQMEYAEIFWEPDHFPDFSPAKLRGAIIDYSRRRRRFGGNDAEEHLTFKPEVAARLELNWWRLSKIPEDKTFEQYAVEHIKEQWGMSLAHAKRAAVHMISAFRFGKRDDWKKATVNLKKFYGVIKEEVKLAFEPSLAASLQIKIWQKTENGEKAQLTREFEDTTRELVTEVYRISDYQANKVAHLRAMATIEKNLAEHGEGEEHWDRAEEYLQMYYRALKDRVA